MPTTHLLCARFAKLFGVNMIVDSIGSKGGLALFWSEKLSVKILSYSIHHIFVLISMSEIPFEWQFIEFYGEPCLTDG